MMNRMLVLAGMLTVSALANGCIPGGDPEGPGAAGKISLGAGVDASAFKTLVVRAVPDTGDPFDPTHPQFTAPAPDGEPTWSADVESMDGMTFGCSSHRDAPGQARLGASWAGWLFRAA